MANLLDQLINPQKKHLVLDGGIGTELRRQGVRLHESAWSAWATIEHPNVLVDIHKKYIAAGADIITANSFSASKHNLEYAGIESYFAAINKNSVKLAKRAKQELGSHEIRIAGSLSTIPPMDQPDCLPTGKSIADNYRRQAGILTDAGVDLLIGEMLLDEESARILVDACLETGLPVWLGFCANTVLENGKVTAFRAPGKYRKVKDQFLATLAGNILSSQIEVAGIMHTKLDGMNAALSTVKSVWDGPLMAYAETGKSGDSDWFFDTTASPSSYATDAMSWINNHDVKIIGGCCGTGPKHIQALSQFVQRL